MNNYSVFFLNEEVIPQIIMLRSNSDSTFIDDKLSGGKTIEFTSNLGNVWIAYRRMLELRHCRNLVNSWLAPLRTDVWGLLTGHSIVKPRLHKSPCCIGLFAGAFLSSNRFSGTASHPNTRRGIPPWLFRWEKVYNYTVMPYWILDIYDFTWQV